MFFILKEQKYEGETAVRIIRKMENACLEYTMRGGALRDFLIWSLERMSDRIPLRELDVSPNLDDETIAFNFLCLLDQLQIGTLGESGLTTEPEALRTKTEQELCTKIT